MPSTIQEGENENALYYAYVLLTPALEKLVIKIWHAPDYSPLAIADKEVESFVFDLVANGDEDELVGYDYGHSSDGQGHYFCIEKDSGGEWIDGNTGKIYNGLTLYPAVKCFWLK